MQGRAYIDGNYRYWLERRWDDGPACLFVMLNPSTADASKDDPTIKRCIGFAKAFGMRALWVCNLYAFRATIPEQIFKVPDPVGPGNDVHLEHYAAQAGLIVAAWGTLGQPARVTRVMNLLEYGLGAPHEGRPVYCLEKTKDGHPKHPLYVRASQRLSAFMWEAPRAE